MLLSLLTTGQADTALTLLTDVFHGLTSLRARPHADRVARRLRERGVEVRPVGRCG
jgi:hypothetical protein